MLKEDVTCPDVLYQKFGESYLHHGAKAKLNYVDIHNARLVKTLFDNGTVLKQWQIDILVHFKAQQNDRHDTIQQQF